MRYRNLAAALLLALPVSTFAVACDRREDSATDRTALERESLDRDLDLALKTDSTVRPQLADVPVQQTPVDTTTPPPPAPAPEPAASAPAREPVRRPPPAPRPREERAPQPAPEPSAPAAPRYVTRSAPAGSSFSVRLDQTLSTRGATVGQTFTATLTEPLVAADGSTVIPAGATVNGRVTDVQASGRAGQKARIAVAFTSISYEGETYPIDGTVTTAPAVRLVTRDSNGEKAAKVAGGAAIGGVVGRVLGKSTRSTIIGAAVGAAAGTAVVMGTSDVDAVISSGSTATIRLDAPVQVRKEA